MTHLGKILGFIWVECSSHGGAWKETGLYVGIKKRQEDGGRKGGVLMSVLL
jgi:hypothetical protein